MKKPSATLIYTTLVSTLLLLSAAARATTCANAIPILAFPVVNQALVCGTANDLNSDTAPDICDGVSNDFKRGIEALYRFTPSVSGAYSISYYGQFYSGIFVYNGCPNTGGFCIGGVGVDDDVQALNINLLAGITYYIWFDIRITNQMPCPGAFSLSLSPSNNNCTGAIPFPAIALDNNCASLTITTVTTVVGLSGPCGGFPDDDVWYTFTTPPGVSQILYNSTSISGNDDRVLQVYEGTCNGGLPSLGCYDEDSGVISGLSGNTTYYLRAYTSDAGPISMFNLCLTATLPNDNCAGAIAFPALPANGNCATVSGNTVNAIGATAPLCGGIPDDDVWFSFFVPTGVTTLQYDITNVSGNPDMAFRLYRGNCSTAVECFDAENGGFSGLLANTTYYIQVFTKEAGAGSVFDICLQAPPQPANNACEGAIPIAGLPLDGSCVMTTISTIGATGTASSTCTGTEDDDVWYTFTTPSGYTAVYYGMTNISGSTNRALQVYSGSCPSALTSLGCYDSESGTITGLTGNTTYYLRVYTFDAGVVSTFNLCLSAPPPPANDYCAGAIAFPELPLDGSCSSVMVITTGATGTPDPTCTGTEDDDVWYTFTTPPGVTSILYNIVNMWGNTSRAFQLFQGTSCNGLVSFGCYQNVAGDLITGLSGNTTYYLRAYTGPSGVSSSFQICLRLALPPAPNDECSDALSFPAIPSVGGSAAVTFSTLGATGSPDNTCQGTEDDDVWLRFTAPPGITTLFYERTVIEGDHEVYFQLFSGTCGNLTSLGCYYTTTNGFIPNLISGNTYYIRIYTRFANLGGTYHLTLRAGEPNDECINAIPFPDFDLNGSCSEVTIAPNEATPTVLENVVTCQFGSYNDLWYSFSVPEGITQIRYYIEDESSFIDHRFQILTGDCSGLTSMGCYQNAQGIITGLSSGVIYYLRGYRSDFIDPVEFNICLRLPPPNDECSGAIAFPSIPANSTCAVVTANTFGAMGPTNDPACTGVEDDDIWFTFTTPPGVTSLFYNIPNAVGASMDFQLFSGNECSGLTPIGCYSASNVYLTGLTGNTTYYLRVYSRATGNNYNNFGAIFDICLSLPATNDDCSGAIAFADLPVDGSCASVTSSTLFGTGTLDPTCSGFEDDDVWFTFTTPPGIRTVHYEINTTPVYKNMALQVFTGECGNLTSIGCYDPETGVMTNLNPGTTYNFRVYGRQDQIGSDFSICLRPELINDDCIQALAFPDIPLDGSCATVTADTEYATGTPDGTCAGTEDDDVWFTFTTPPGVTKVAYKDILIDGTANANRSFQIFSGECSNLTSIGCYDLEEGVITGLSGSTTYYLRAYTSFGSSFRAIFNICLQLQVPDNDECSGAFAFPSIPTNGSCATLNISTRFATGANDPTCSGAEDDDVWYTFTTPPGVTVLAYQRASNVNDLNFQVFSNDCNSLNSIGCFTNLYGTITGLSGNTTYYLRAYTFGTGVAYTGDFCLRVIPPNDLCAAAISFPAIPVDGSCASVTGYTIGAGGFATSNCVGAEDDDIWYTFTTPPNVTQLLYKITGIAPALANEDMVLEVSRGPCTFLSQQTCYDPEAGTLTGLVGNTTYYLRVYTKSLDTRSIFNMCLQVATPNDNCPGATAFPALPMDGNCASITVSGFSAFASGLPTCIGSNTTSLDVWYTFTTPPDAEGVIGYQVTGFSGIFPFELQIFSGACGNLVSIGCYDAESGFITGLAGGATYYLRTYASQSATAPTYDICLRLPQPPVNDLCPQALAFPELLADGSCATVIARTQRATGTDDPTCDGAEDDDVWFTFTTPPGATYLGYETSHIAGSSSRNFQILGGSCGQLVPIGCYAGDFGIITGLAGNTTYYLRAYSASTSDSTAFSLCLRLPVPSDNCMDALLIERCNTTRTIQGTFDIATEDGLNSSCVANVDPNTKGVWYRFVGDGLPVMLHTCVDSDEAGILVYSGSCESLACVTGNAGACGSGSQVNWVTTAGETYYIYVYPFDNSAEDFTLSLIGNEVCPAVINPMATNISHSSATISWPEHGDILSYDYTISTSGFCSFGLLNNSTGNTVSLTGLIPDTEYTFCVRSNCDCPGSQFTSISFTTLPQSFPNDYCADAFPVLCGTTITGSTQGAVPDLASGSCGPGIGLTPGNGIWYKLVGDGSLVTLDLCASAYDTRVHVYGGACGNIECVAENDNACGPQSKVSFHALPNVNYFILVSGTDANTGDFTMNVSCICDEPLGPPWTATGIGGTQGDAINNYCGGTIDMSAAGSSSPNPNAREFFAFQNLCDTFTITAKVNQITTNDFAGIALRETTAAGSRVVAFKSKGTKFVYRDIRSVTNGSESTQQFFTLNHRWLRLVRNGDQIVGYSSGDGAYWQEHFATNLAMPSCVEAGLFVESTQMNALAEGAFSNVSIFTSTFTSGLNNDGNVPTGDVPTSSDTTNYVVYPNPAKSAVTVKMDKTFLGKELTITIHNQFHQIMAVRKIDEVQDPIETFNVEQLPPGVYIITLRTESRAVLSKKFIVGR